MKWKNSLMGWWGLAIFIFVALAMSTWKLTPARASRDVQRVADIYPGETGSFPRFMTVFNEKLYFAADGNDGAGRTLWMYDGVNSPTNVWSETQNSSPSFLMVFDNKLYFAATGNGLGQELWVYDGIHPPTQVADIYVGQGSSSPTSLVVFDNKLYFAATSDDQNGYRLWMYDGVSTPSLAPPLGDKHFTAMSVSYLTVYNNKLYFSADVGDGDGAVLWVYDGVTFPKKVWVGGGNPQPTSLVVYGGKLYFQAAYSEVKPPARLLWVYDGTNPPGHACIIIHCFTYFDSTDSLYSMAVYRNQIFMQASDEDFGAELWKYQKNNEDGSIFLAANINPNENSGSYPSYLVVFKDTLNFLADGGDGAGTELWTYYEPTVGSFPTMSLTFTPSPTKTQTPTVTFTPSETPTATSTPTNTNTPTQTYTPSQTPTRTFTPTATFSPTSTATSTPINTVTFEDVPRTHWAWLYVEHLYHAGLTGGCSSDPMLFCPNAVVTRAQMAVFLLRGIHGATYIPPAASGTKFQDVPADHWAAAWIEQLANEGITGGCGNGNYCPGDEVTRDQAAVLLLRAKYGPSYIPPVASGTLFADVPSNHWAAAWIEQLAKEGITSGCSNGNYCPAAVVTRAQMAVFLVKALILPPLPPTATATKTPTETPTPTATSTKTPTSSPTQPCTDGC